VSSLLFDEFSSVGLESLELPGSPESLEFSSVGLESLELPGSPESLEFSPESESLELFSQAPKMGLHVSPSVSPEQPKYTIPAKKASKTKNTFFDSLIHSSTLEYSIIRISYR
jgi:hypothetical protein